MHDRRIRKMKTKAFRNRQAISFRSGWRMFAAVCAVFCLAVDSVSALPIGQQVVSGQAQFQKQGTQLTITNTPRAIISWGSFSIAANETVRFAQQSTTSTVLNRIVGQDPSRILGALQSNGKVFLVNPNGILFGQTARVDVNGLVASTLNITNQDFLAGKYAFAAGESAGSVINQGVITAPSGGTVALIGSSVENSGIINSPRGEVLLAAGRSIQLVDVHTPDIAVVVSAPDDKAVNLGQIIAQSGTVGIYGALVSQKGIINADSAVAGDGGKIIFKASKASALDTGSVTTADGKNGGQITVQADAGAATVAGKVSAVGSDEKGGNIQILGRNVALTETAQVSANGNTVGGSILIGGDWQGSNPAIRNAEATSVAQGATISADSIGNGDGGKVVIWANDRTVFYGSISARGGENGGNGGNVEVSGKQNLIYRGTTDVRAPKGMIGSLLLDPTDYTIGTDIAGAALGAQLDLANVTIQTAAAGVQPGDITVSDAITWGSNATLTLSAHNDINVNNTITNSHGGSLVLRGDSDADGAGNVFFGGPGHVTLTGGGNASILYNPPGGYTTPTNYAANVTGIVPTAYMLVNTVTDLQNISSNLAGTYALGKDIDATVTNTWNAGAGFVPLGDNSLIPAQSFTGTFDGFGHTITNLFINRPATDYVGLFGGTIGNAGNIIRNVGLVNVNVTGHFQVAGLVAHTGASVSNSYVTGTVTGTGNTVGGLVALNAGTISKSYSTATVSSPAGNFVGGLVGSNYSGATYSAIISDSFSTGSVTGNSDVGGLVGNVSNSGSVNSITNSYSTGSVSGSSNRGGLIGRVTGGAVPITNCYWNTATSGLATSAGGTGLTTAQMRSAANFVGWDFINNWNITEGVSYPYLIFPVAPVVPVGPTPPAPPPAAAGSTPAITLLSLPTRTIPAVLLSPEATRATVVAVDSVSTTGSAKSALTPEGFSSEEATGNAAEDQGSEPGKKQVVREGGEKRTHEIKGIPASNRFCN